MSTVGGLPTRANEGGANGSEPPPKKHKNAHGIRSDVARKHGASVDGDARKVACKYYQKPLTGGVYRLKHYLTRTTKDVEACRSVPKEVQKKMLVIICSLQQNNISDIKRGSIGSYAPSEEANGGASANSNVFKRNMSSQVTFISMLNKKEWREACKDIALFFYNNVIPFNVANIEEYKRVFELILRAGRGFKPPFYYDIRVK